MRSTDTVRATTGHSTPPPTVPSTTHPPPAPAVRDPPARRAHTHPHGSAGASGSTRACLRLFATMYQLPTLAARRAS
eukprot:7381561-Prymnesium_polylepis.1